MAKKYKSTHMSLDTETADILAAIPDGHKSSILRALLVAYKEFVPVSTIIPKHYLAMSGKLKLIESSEVTNVAG